MAKIFLLAYGLVLLGLAQADYPFNWDRDLKSELLSEPTRNTDPGYRLPSNIIPIEYDIDIEMFFEEGGSAGQTAVPYSYIGIVTIIVQANGTTNEIVIHENVDTISSLTITAADGVPVLTDSMNPFDEEPLYHFLKINLVSPLVDGDLYTITIGYQSTMNLTPMRRGIWRGRYEGDDGTEHFYATAHFQPYSARQAFPCFDEPALKAVFNLHITRPSSYSGTFSNMPILTSAVLPNDRVRDTFHPTPRMSTYLLTFLVSEHMEVLAESNELDIPVRIIGRHNAGQGSAQHALELSVSLTKYFEEFFGITYAMMDPNINNDHFASPDWASAGTENWGFVGYRELYLLYDQNETPIDTEQYMATLISHEIVHSWFGNWMTCFWWSNTWINEGYASYFGYMAVQEVEPKYELDEHFNGRYLQTSLAYDSSASTEALNHEVNSPTEVTSHFGTISYSKGAAFLRMTKDTITPETFRKGIQYFLQNHAFEPANQHDMFEAFAQAVSEDGTTEHITGFDIYSFLDYWVEQPGYPIINVEINYGTGDMTISQERFFISPTAEQTNQVWPVPITYVTASNPDFNNVRPDFVLAGRSAVINIGSGHDWVIVNTKQHGHYRVNYDDHSWEHIRQILMTEPDKIHHLNRAQIVDDVFALMRSNRMSYMRGFEILRFLEKEVNYHVLEPAITGYTWFRNRMRHLPEQLAEFDSNILAQLQYAIDTYTYDIILGETSTQTQTRLILLAFACNLGHEGCVTDALQRWNSFRETQWMSPHLRRHVFTVGIREGTNDDYQFLLNRMLNSNVANDDYVMLRGLGASKDPATITQFLEMTLDPTIIRPHDIVNAFNMALLGNVENAVTALQFTKDNIDAMRVAYSPEAQNRPLHTIFSNLASYLDEENLQDMEAWLRSTQTGTPEYTTGMNAIASARANREWGSNNADNIIGAVRGGSPALSVTFSLLLVAGLCTLIV